jgi:uncharacterized protein (DUF433 family)
MTEMVDERDQKLRVPGITFADGPAGRRAVVEGTGLDVWEIIATWKAGSESYPVLRQNYPWLSEAQLRAALGYYAMYPSEIDARLEREARWTPERVWREFPFSWPRNH